MTSGNPVNTPQRPAHCPDCGGPYTWTEREDRIANASIEHSALATIQLICDRFHLVVRQIRERRSQRPTLDVSDEYDVQDLFHALLRLYFDDVRAEEATPSYAGKSSRIDFLVKDESIGIEVKMTRVGLAAKDLGTQLVDDIARYKEHPNCNTLVCFVYDPDGRISNPDGIVSDLSQLVGDFHVHVIIVPRGY